MGIPCSPVVFVPMFGDFFNAADEGKKIRRKWFSSPCLGIFFLSAPFKKYTWTPNKFSSPCLGIFFYMIKELAFIIAGAAVFVPMFGDLFLWGKL